LSTSTSSPSASQTFSFTPALEEKIRLRAYEIYLRRGATAGNELDDWLRAESEIIAQPATAAPATILTLKKPRAKRAKK
jgi:hypothetical protein